MRPDVEIRKRLDKMRDKKTKKIAYLGMFITLALIASYVESLVPFYFGAPGIKLGLANLITVVLLYRSP